MHYLNANLVVLDLNHGLLKVHLRRKTPETQRKAQEQQTMVFAWVFSDVATFVVSL